MPVRIYKLLRNSSWFSLIAGRTDSRGSIKVGMIQQQHFFNIAAFKKPFCISHALYSLMQGICHSVPDFISAEWWTTGLLIGCSMTCIHLQNNLLSISDRSLWMSYSLSINQLCSSCIFLYLSFKKERTVSQDASIAPSVTPTEAVQDVRELLDLHDQMEEMLQIYSYERRHFSTSVSG